jgi:hypothetical protein
LPDRARRGKSRSGLERFGTGGASKVDALGLGFEIYQRLSNCRTGEKN